VREERRKAPPVPIVRRPADVRNGDDDALRGFSEAEQRRERHGVDRDGENVPADRPLPVRRRRADEDERRGAVVLRDGEPVLSRPYARSAGQRTTSKRSPVRGVGYSFGARRSTSSR